MHVMLCNLSTVLSELGFKALSFTSATIYWAAWPIVKSECIHNYSVLVQSVHTPSISDNTMWLCMCVHIHNHICELVGNSTTANTILNVSGLTRGVEYTVTVYGVYNDEVGRSATIFMNLDGKVDYYN